MVSCQPRALAEKNLKLLLEFVEFGEQQHENLDNHSTSIFYVRWSFSRELVMIYSTVFSRFCGVAREKFFAFNKEFARFENSDE
jgi:hypothetical protein